MASTPKMHIKRTTRNKTSLCGRTIEGSSYLLFSPTTVAYGAFVCQVCEKKAWALVERNQDNDESNCGCKH